MVAGAPNREMVARICALQKKLEFIDRPPFASLQQRDPVLAHMTLGYITVSESAGGGEVAGSRGDD